jgi:hypothetical protein
VEYGCLGVFLKEIGPARILYRIKLITTEMPGRLVVICWEYTIHFVLAKDSERCFVEVRRRTRPILVFTNVVSVDRITYAILSRCNEDW